MDGMAQLRSCYFCGGVGDSLREYEVVPERLDSGGGRSAVLCSTCHEKLRRVLEPLADTAESTTTTDATGPESASLQEVTFDSGGDGGTAGDDGTAEKTEDATPERAAATADEERAAAGGDDERTGRPAATDDDESTASPGEDVPEDYYTVLRLLQNREFPMQRAALIELVTGAYDVSEPQCERILEAAIERGVLVADGSTFDIGRN
jgi:hypothetical protein